AAKTLSKAGVNIADAVPDLSSADDAFRILRAHQFAASRGEILDGPGRHLLKPEVIWNIEQGLELVGADISAAVRKQARCRASLLAFLDRHDFLLTATAPVAPFPVGERYVSRIAGRELA